MLHSDALNAMSQYLNTLSSKAAVKCPSELLLLGPFLQPSFHLLCMLLAALPLLQSLLLHAVTHSAVHFVARAEELHDIVLHVALPQLVYQFIALVRVQVRRQIRVHSELRVY